MIKNISVITLNLYGVPFSKLSKRLDRICAIIQSLNPDIINFQQAHDYSVVLRLDKRLANYPYHSFAKGMLGPQSGLITYSKHPIAATESTVVNKANRLLGLFTKGILLTRLVNNIEIYNVHLSANTDGDWSNKSRFHKMHKHELTLLQKYILQTQRSSHILVTGDFNIAGDSPVFREFIKKSRLHDALATDYTPTFHKEFLPAGEPGRRIDQVLTTGQVNAYSFAFNELIGSYGVRLVFLSDHIGVYASIDIPS